MKRLYSVLLICAAMAGMMLSITSTEAADLAKVRGRVNIDLDTFVCVEKTNNNSGMEPDNSEKTKYKMWFKNSFTDRNNIGVTYRSGQSYEMTDVDKVETYMYTQQTSNDKFLLYINTSPYKYYHRMDIGDINNGTLDGNGTVWYFNNLVVRVTQNVYSKDFRDRSTNIKAKYGSSYVFFGLAHEWQMHDARLYFDNESRSGEFQGGLTLILKKHRIALLQPEYPKQVLENGSEKEYVAFSNLKMRLEDGKSYDPGSQGDIYRDERVTVQYTLADANNCKLKGYRFYSDRDRKNLLYTKWIEGGETESSFTLNAALIQDLERGKAIKSLGDIYVEPIFEQRKVTVDISQIVPEDSAVSVTPVTGGDGSDSFQLQVEENGKKEVIGSFKKNTAAHIGDVITFDYTPNSKYKGPYQFSHYEYRMCESQNQVAGTYPVEALYSPDKYDISQKLGTAYFWMQLHVILKAEVVLQDKTVTYNNRNVTIDPPEIKYPEGHPAPTGTITYTYYKALGDVTQWGLQEEIDGPPIDAGIYYVVATMRQDAHYLSAESRPAILTIEKAVPVLSNVRGTQITYGDQLSKSTVTGTAEGVSKSKISGTFAWKDGNQKPNAGTNKADVKFTPADRYAVNYAEAEGKGMVSVAPATPTIQKGADKTVTYSGEPVVMEGAFAAGIDGENTGQKITYEYFTSEGCEKESKLAGPPVDRGVYYGLASAAAQGNYNYVKTTADNASKITIEPRQAGLLQVPVSALTGAEGAKEYRVYVTNAVAEGPKGTVQLSWMDGGEKKQIDIGGIRKEGNGYYASIQYGDGGVSFADEKVKITASYMPVTDNAGNHIDNYSISEDQLEVDTSSGAIEKEVYLEYGGEACTESVETALQDSIPAGAHVSDVRWKMPDRTVNDVAETEIGDNDNNTMIFTPLNAGSVSVTAYVTVTTQGTTGNALVAEDHYYVTYHCTVSKVEQDISLIDENELTYNGLPQTRRIKREPVGEEKAGDVTDISDIRYTGNSYIEGSYDSELPPVHAGTYTMKVTVPATRNLLECETSFPLVINQAKPAIAISNKTVTYNGHPQTLEPAVLDSGIPNGTDVTGAVSYQYTYIGSVPVNENGDSQADTAAAEPTGAAAAEQINSPDAPVHAGVYEVTASVAADGNYTSAISTESQDSSVKLTIKQAGCTVKMQGKQAVYTGEPILLDPPVITGVENESVTAETAVMYRPSVIWHRQGGGQEFIQNPTDAGIYYGWAVKGSAGDYKAAVSERALLVIRKAQVNVAIPEQTAVYSGKTPTIQGLTVQTETGKDIMAESIPFIRYHFFSDPEAAEEIEPPVNAGTYYVQAWLAERDNYQAAKSPVQKLTVEKAVPVLSDVRLSDITYGEMGYLSEAEGLATGVEAEELSGAFLPEGEICQTRMDAGTYEVNVRFTPDADTAVNYQTAVAAVPLTVLPSEPQIIGRDKTKVYDGQPAVLDEVWLKGVQNMPAPAGEIRYEYFTDKACTQPAPGNGGSGDMGAAHTGVTDAGVYYCRVTVIPDTGNYIEKSELYTVTVEKAPAAISLRVTVIDKNQADNIVTIRGKLPGVFDAPTGTVRILMREHAEDGQNAGEYREVTGDLAVTEENGAYGFTAKVSVGLDGIYDFKAVYTEGVKQNYKIQPGELTEIDMDKLPQHIEFEQHLLRMMYGCEAFDVRADESEAPGSGAVTYRLMENISTPGAVSVTPEGTVEILDVGTAFVMAVKAGDEQYNGAVSVVCIRILKAPVTLAMEDRTVVYDGSPQGIQAVPMSQDQRIEEELPVSYVYVDQENRRVLHEEPVDTGTYQVFAYLPETEHYLGAAGRSVLVITQTEARIELSVYKKDVNAQKVTLRGRLPGVFDDPNGTVTIYMRVHGTEEYTVAAEDIQIVEIDGEWTFWEEIHVPESRIYDFKAVFVGDAGQNYRIQDGIAENVDMRKPHKPGRPSGDDPGTDDPNGPGSDPGADDPNGSGNDPGSNGSGGSGGGPSFDDVVSGGADKGGKSKAADTGDAVPVLPGILFVMAAAVLMTEIGRRYRMRCRRR